MCSSVFVIFAGIKTDVLFFQCSISLFITRCYRWIKNRVYFLRILLQWHGNVIWYSKPWLIFQASSWFYGDARVDSNKTVPAVAIKLPISDVQSLYRGRRQQPPQVGGEIENTAKEPRK